MRARYTRREREIAKRLGVTDAGLRVLVRGFRQGRVRGPGMGHESISAAAKLHAQGHADAEGNMTESGRTIVLRARAEGY